MDNKETVIAAALVILFYWFTKGKAEAAEGLISEERGVIIPEYKTREGIYVEGNNYYDDTSHIFIRYPGLNIFTPLTKGYDNVVDESKSKDIDSYIDTIRASESNNQKTLQDSLLDLDGIADIYIAAPIISSIDFSRVQILSPERISSTTLANTGRVRIPQLILINRLPAEFVSMVSVHGKGGPGYNFYSIFKVTVRYPKDKPEVLQAVLNLLTEQYAYSYDYLKSLFGDI